MPLTFDESPNVVTFDEAPTKVASTTSSKNKSALEQLNAIEPAVAPIKEEKPSLLDKFRSGVATVGKIAEGMATLPMATISGLTDKVLNPESDFESNVSKWNEKYSSPSSDLTQEYLQKVAPALDALNAVMPDMQLMHQVTRPAILKAPQVEIPPIDPLKAKLDAAAKAKETVPVQKQQADLQLEPAQNPYGVDTSKFTPDENGIPINQSPELQSIGNQGELFGRNDPTSEVVPQSTILDTETNPSIRNSQETPIGQQPMEMGDLRDQIEIGLQKQVENSPIDSIKGDAITQAPDTQAGDAVRQFRENQLNPPLNFDPTIEPTGQLPLGGTGKRGFGQGGSVDPKVFLEGLEKVLGFVPKSLEAAKYALGDKLSSAMDRRDTVSLFGLKDKLATIDKLQNPNAGKFGQGGAFTPFSSSKKLPTFEEFRRKYSEYPEDVLRQVYEEEFGSKAKGEVIQNIPGFKWEMKKTQDVADALFSTKTMSDINDATTGRMYSEAKDLGYTREIANEVSNKLSTPGDMSPLAKSFYENYYKPLMDGARKIYAEIKGIDPEAPILKLYQPRISADKGYWNQFFSGLTSSYGGGFSFGNKPGALKARSVFKAVSPDGHEFIVSQGKDRLLTAWEDKNASLLPYDVKAIKVGDTLPDGTKIIDATQKEIETHTNKKYIQDPLFVGMLKKQQLDRYLAQQKILEEIKKSPIWETHASRVEENNPNHVQLKYGDRIPTLNQYKFDPELAHVFDDFLKSKYDSATGWQMIGAFNNLAIKSFMLLPIKHINNEFVHLVVADGLTGAVPDAAKLKSLAQGTTDALTFSPFYQEVARQGGSLLYPRTVVDGLVEKNMQNLITQAKNDSKFVETLQSYGLKPVDFFNAWSKASSHSMWLARDAMYMSLIRDKVANGMSIRDAIIKTDQYMPNYRIPTRVLGSRTLSEVMQNPSMTAFSAYHHGALKAMGTTLKKSLVPEDGIGITPQRMEGINHLAAYTLMMAIIYPMLDKAYQWAAGTPENTPEDLKPKMRRAGGFSYIERGIQALENKDPRALYNETLTPAPSMALLQAFPGINTDSFTRKEIYNYKDPLPLQAIDTAKWLGMKEFNAAGSMSIVRETKRGVPLKDAMVHWATDQLLDVKTPDPKAEQYKKVLDVQEQQKANKNFNKRNSVEKAIGKGWKEGKDLLNMSGETSKKLTYGDTNNYGIIHNKFQEAQQKMDNRIKNPIYGTNLKNKFLAEGQENPIQYLQQKDNEAASKGLKQWKFSKKAST